MRIQSKMHHPFIVPLFTYKEENDEVYILMQYCPGGNFRKYINLI